MRSVLVVGVVAAFVAGVLDPDRQLLLRSGAEQPTKRARPARRGDT